jgi:hypothetical protein
MSNDKLRRQIIFEAARMMCAGQESDCYRAKIRAARRFYRGWIKPADLPTDREIREQIQVMTRTGDAGAPPTPPPIGPIGAASDMPSLGVDRFQVYRTLLAPLEMVKQNPKRHPEGDALYHSLQVFELARDALPYDEEFQSAALLHDVGKAIDPRDHVAAGLAALNGFITPRTAWFIENHSAAGALRDGTLGARARRRLEAAEDFDDLMLLCDCDRQGRQKGAQAPELEEAIEHLRELARSNDAA